MSKLLGLPVGQCMCLVKISAIMVTSGQQFTCDSMPNEDWLMILETARFISVAKEKVYLFLLRRNIVRNKGECSWRLFRRILAIIFSRDDISGFEGISTRVNEVNGWAISISRLLYVKFLQKLLKKKD